MKKMMIILAMAIMLTGCQKTPTTTVINNNEDSFTSEAIDVEETTTEAWEDMTVATITTEEINEVFQIGNKTITFAGTISIPDRVDGLYTYKAIKTSYDEYFENMTFLFGEYEDEAYVPTNFFSGEPEIGHLEVMSEDGYRARINNARAENTEDIEVDYPPSNIHFRMDWDPIVEDYEVPIYMTNEEAKEKSDEIIDKIGVNGFEIHKFVYGHNPVSEGYEPLMDTLSVNYRQYLQGVPLITYYGQHNECGILINFVSRGLSCVYISEYSFERVARNEQCLTYEEALECFKNYVDSCDYYEDAVFRDINFQYVIVEDEHRERFVVPCYEFEVSPNQRYPDIYVDARDGKIYSRVYR